MEPVSVKISDALRERVQDEAEKRGTTFSGAIRDVLSEHFDRADQMSEVAQMLGEIRSIQVLALAMLFAKSKDLEFGKDVLPEIEKIAAQWEQIVRAGDLEADHG